jgi:hypothetical protein
MRVQAYEPVAGRHCWRHNFFARAAKTPTKRTMIKRAVAPAWRNWLTSGGNANMPIIRGTTATSQKEGSQTRQLIPINPFRSSKSLV